MYESLDAAIYETIIPSLDAEPVYAGHLNDHDASTWDPSQYAATLPKSISEYDQLNPDHKNLAVQQGDFWNTAEQSSIVVGPSSTLQTKSKQAWLLNYDNTISNNTLSAPHEYETIELDNIHRTQTLRDKDDFLDDEV